MRTECRVVVTMVSELRPNSKCENRSEEKRTGISHYASWMVKQYNFITNGIRNLDLKNIVPSTHSSTEDESNPPPDKSVKGTI